MDKQKCMYDFAGVLLRDVVKWQVKQGQATLPLLFHHISDLYDVLGNLDDGKGSYSTRTVSYIYLHNMCYNAKRLSIDV